MGHDERFPNWNTAYGWVESDVGDTSRRWTETRRQEESTTNNEKREQTTLTVDWVVRPAGEGANADAEVRRIEAMKNLMVAKGDR